MTDQPVGGATASSFNPAGSPFKDLPAQKRFYGGHINRSNEGRAAKVFNELSMSHEEKALRNNYGNNFDGGVLTIQQTSLQSPVKLARGLYGAKMRTQGRSTARNDNSGRKTALNPYTQAQSAMSRNQHSSTQLRQGGNDLAQLGPYNTYAGTSSNWGSQERLGYQQEKLNNARIKGEAAQQRQEALQA